MDSAVHHTPVEIWQKILRYAISTPVFFDINPADTCSVEELNRYNREAPYWDSERTRNSLRCVCSSWNAFLHRFEHRYVRLNDVMHGLVPLYRISGAIRLNLDRCFCKQCRAPGMSKRRVNHNRLATLRDLSTHHPQPWSIEILYGEISREEDLNLLRYCAPHIRSIIRRHPYNVLKASDHFPDLVTLCGTTDDSALLFLQPEDNLRFIHLTTFQVDLTSLEPCSRWHLPALRHFSFLYNSPEYSPEPLDFINMLKAIGSQIKCLFYFGRPLDVQIPPELWKLCPQLERLQVPMLWGTNPPRQYPLFFVRIDVDALVSWGQQFTPNSWDDAIARYFPTAAHYGAGVRKSMLSCSWSDVIFGISPDTKEVVLRCKEVAEDTGLSLADVKNVTFEHYIVFLLSTFWREKSLNGQRQFRHLCTGP